MREPPPTPSRSPRRRAGSISSAAQTGRNYVLVLVGLLAAGLVLECARHLIRRDEPATLLEADETNYLPDPRTKLSPGDTVNAYELVSLAGHAGGNKLPAPIEGIQHFTPALPHPRDACALTESEPGAQTSFRWAIKKRLNRGAHGEVWACLLYTSPSPRDGLLSRMPSSA